MYPPPLTYDLHHVQEQFVEFHDLILTLTSKKFFYFLCQYFSTFWS